MRKSDDIKVRLLGNRHDIQISESLHDEIAIWLYRRIESSKHLVKLITKTQYQEIHDFSRELEVPLYMQAYKSMTIAGFADLSVTSQIKRLYTDEDFKKAYDAQDLAHMKREKFYIDSYTGFVEVKTKVNVGETIRQITYYRSCRTKEGSPINSCQWSVCAPSCPDADILKDHDINFIPYKPDEEE